MSAVPWAIELRVLPSSTSAARIVDHGAATETHTVENISGRPMRACMVEIKDKDWAPSTG